MAKAQKQNTVLHTERALSELKRGQSVLLLLGSRKLLLWAAETVEAKTLPKGVHLLLTANRAHALWPFNKSKAAVSLPLRPKLIKALAEIIGTDQSVAKPEVTVAPKSIQKNRQALAALELVKLAELAPAAVVLEKPNAAQIKDVLSVKVSEVERYQETAAMALQQVVEAPLTLKEARDAKIVGFRAPSSGREHFAIIVGSPKKTSAPLVRIHSSCYTGDLLNSLKCDCRDQLQEALHFMAENGGGVLLYLMQEGRGIGLVNKLRAYKLQAEGKDTVDANEILGFEDDERPFLAASQMLKKLGFTKVKLLTNNPRKVKGLEACGIKVTKRVDHVIAPHEHNEKYLKTKFSRLGHVRK